MTCGPRKSDWKRQLDASVFALRSDVLETLQQRIYELQEQQICNLKEQYGIRWDQMTETASGSGYAMCREILSIIDDMRRRDYYDFMTPYSAMDMYANLRQNPETEQLLEQFRRDQLSKICWFQNKEEDQ